jgi:hypothetical protein
LYSFIPVFLFFCKIIAFSSVSCLYLFHLASLHFCRILTFSSPVICHYFSYLHLFLCKILTFSSSVNCPYLFLLASILFHSSWLSPRLDSTVVLLLPPSTATHQSFDNFRAFITTYMNTPNIYC